MPNLNGPYLGYWETRGLIALLVVGLYFALLYWIQSYQTRLGAWIERLIAQWNYRRVKKNEAQQYAEYNRVRREKLLSTSRKLSRMK